MKMPSLVLNRASCTSVTLVALVQFPVICHATIREMDGCDHYSECVNELWFVIWMLIMVATIIYFVLLAWTCWISSKHIIVTLIPLIHLLLSVLFLRMISLLRMNAPPVS